MQNQRCIDVKFRWWQAQARNMLRNGKCDLVDAAEERANFLAGESVNVHDDRLHGRCDRAIEDGFRCVERASVLDF